MCHQERSSRGIHSHYLIVHTKDGLEKHKQRMCKVPNLGALHNKKIGEANKLKYLQHPNYCECCHAIIPYRSPNRFCSSSCAAKVTNKKHPKESRERQAKTVSKTLKGKPRLSRRLSYSRLSFCVVCGSTIPNKYVKTCSDSCLSKLMSKLIIERIKINKRSNYRRDRSSYLEKSFESWLLQNKVTYTYIPEYYIHNHLTNKRYFVDFYFPALKLIIELDGKQHETSSNKERDKLRDNYIKTYLGLEIIRISHSEYISKTKIEQLTKILVPHSGTAPDSMS